MCVCVCVCACVRVCVCDCECVCECECELHVCALHSLWPHKVVIWRYVVQLLLKNDADVNIRRKVRFFTVGLCVLCVCCVCVCVFVSVCM